MAADCRMYEAKYPEVDDVVMVMVRGEKGGERAVGDVEDAKMIKAPTTPPVPPSPAPLPPPPF